MFHAATFLALHAYRVGRARDLCRADWLVTNRLCRAELHGEPREPAEATLGLLVYYRGRELGHARMDAQEPCGYSELTVHVEPDRAKVCELLAAWVAINAVDVYPHALGRQVPALTGPAKNGRRER